MESTPDTVAAADPRQVQYTHVMYALHAVTILIGVFTAGSAAGWFMFLLPSLIATAMNYLRVREVRGTWLAAHFRWLLWTFWASAALIICLSPLVFTIVLIPEVIAVQVAVGLWASYRIGRGWLALRDGRTLPS